MMKLPALTSISVVLVVSAGVPTAAAKTGGYRLVDLGTLGGESSYATAMNDHGAVVGSSAVADGGFHGFVWRRGRMTDLGSFRPLDINNHGQMVGTVDGADTAYLWRAGRLIDLGTLGGTFSFPTAISDRGQVVGMSATTDGRRTAFLWSKRRMRPLPLDDASDINERGQVAGGKLHGGDGFHATVWYRGKLTDLGARAFDRSNTYGINGRGWIIGWTFSADRSERGTLWRKSRLTDLGTLGGATTRLVAINDRGQILAESQIPDGRVHPALWHRGRWTDLTTKGVTAEGEVVDLNDRGTVAATIRPVFGISHAVLYRKTG